MDKKRLKRQIEYMLSLEDDFDGEGSPGYKKETTDKAKRYLVYMEKELERKKLDMGEPNFLMGPDGSVDIHWKNKKYELLFNVPAEDKPATYWGDNYHKGWEMEGEILLEK